jgi:hypothetical protein
MRIFLSLIVLPIVTVLSFAACDSTAVHEYAATASADARPAGACVNVRHTGEGLLGAPVVIPIGEEPIVGAGGLPTPTPIGPYNGMMSSVLLSETPQGNGAVRYELVHYWVNGDDSFWTEDRAVCSPVGTNPLECLVNNRMTVVGGTGRFAGASGHLHNRGLITIYPEPTMGESGVLIGSLEINLTGRVCGRG